MRASLRMMPGSDTTLDTSRLFDVAGGALRSRWLRVTSVLVGGTILSLLLFRALEKAEADRVALDFRRDAQDRVAAFQVGMTHGLDSLVALEALYGTELPVDRRSFRAFVQEHLLEEPGVSFLGWAPRVVAAERASFEAAVRSQVDDRPDIAAALKSFGVFEVEDGSPRPAAPRPEYFPVLLAEPARIGRHTLGYDLASDAVQGEALARARSARGMTASGRDVMNPRDPEKFAVLIANPVFGEGSSDEADRGALQGFLIGMFDVGAVLERSLEALEPRGVDIAIHDLDAFRSESLLHLHVSRLRGDDRPSWTIEEALEPSALSTADTVEVGDRRWLISCRPAPGYVVARAWSLPLLGLLGGLILTGVMGSAFFSVMGREEETRRYAIELLAAKQQLEQEAAERDKAQRELMASRERLRSAFVNAPIGTAALDLEGRFLEANPALCEMLQYEEHELVGMSVADLTHPADVVVQREQMERLLRDEVTSVRFAERLRRRDGSEIWEEVSLSLVRDENGEPLYFVGQQQDVTEQRRHRAQLVRAQEMQRRILDSLPLNVFLKDSEGRLQFLNAKGREFLGLERKDVMGRTDFDFFPEEQALALREIDQEVLRTGRTLRREETVTVGEKTLHLLAGKTRIEVEGAEGPYLLGFSLDLTAVKEAEEALSRSEFRFRQLVENMSSGVAVYEALDDGTDFVFRDYNRAAERMDGIERKDVIGRLLSDVFPGAGEMGLTELLASVWRSGEPRRLAAARYEDTRLEAWRDNYLYKLPSGEIVAIYDDVTERKRLEANLLHAQKMEAVGRLAGGVAHDFNNLLQVVAGNIDLLMTGTFRPEEHDRMLREIQEQSERGTQLVRQLLAFSRRESFAPAAMDLGDVLRGAETLVRRLLKENIELVVDLAVTPLPVKADKGQLEQVLMNLVVNASDAMPEGGRLEVRSGTQGDDEVWFSVSDSGSGLEEEMLEKIFDPYFTTKAAAQGTGLGLAVVDGIVSLHGGRVDVDNRPGAGVEFRIVFPRTDSRPRASSPQIEDISLLRSDGERVLVVEDQELVRRTIETMLVSLGYEVTTAADGAAARDLASQEEFDLLVSDIVLPDTTGVELAHELRSESPALAVLLVSGYAEEAVRQRGADLHFLQKPFRLEDLARQAAASLAERTVRPA